jgi:hypothetical protein
MKPCPVDLRPSSSTMGALNLCDSTQYKSKNLRLARTACRHAHPGKTAASMPHTIHSVMTQFPVKYRLRADQVNRPIDTYMPPVAEFHSSVRGP